MQRLGFTLIILGLLHMTGLDLAIAQLDAWSSMLQDRYESGLVQAVASTFSGGEPCAKCEALKKERVKRKSAVVYSLSLEKFKHSLPRGDKLPTCHWIHLSSSWFAEVLTIYDSVILESISPPPQRVS